MSYTTRLLHLTIPALFILGELSAQQPLPPAYGVSTVTNSVRTWTARRPFVNESDIVSVSSIADAQQNTRYYDGYGRPMQSVLRQGSPLGNDMVTANTYNSLGQEQFKYLPFTSTVAISGDQTADGNFKADAFQQQAAFYNTLLSGQTGETNVGPGSLNWAYSQDNYEPSPLNRLASEYSPGSSWVGSQGTSTPHGAQQLSLSNTSTDNVQIWNISGWSLSSPQSNIVPASGGAYGAGQLYKTITTDEQGHQVIEFTDKYGQVLLKKVQATAVGDNGTGSGYTGWLCTYYVYDDRGNLRFVITPDLVATMAASGTWSISLLQADELCYRMEYDLLNHMIIQKSPGTPSGSTGEVWFVYDQRNRLVMKQDGNLRGRQKWQYFQYDNLDRPIAKGLITDPTNYNNLSYHVSNAATSANTSAGVSAWPVLSSYTNELLGRTFYDTYSGIASPLSQTIDAGSNGTGYSSFITSYNTSPAYAQPMTQTIMTQGMTTGITDEVLGSAGAQYLSSVNFYDDKGRIIQTQSTNYSGGKDIITTQYDWSGKGLGRLMTHNYSSSTTPQTHQVYTTMTYDAAGRLLTISKAVNSTVTTAGVPAAVTSPATTIVSNQYDEAGRLKKKTLGVSLESLSYEYNVRGWPLGLNRSYISGSTSNYFGMELAYDKTGSIAPGTSYQYSSTNGNVAGEVWKSKGDGINRKYDFNYDNANRLSSAAFLQNSSPGVWDNSFLDFSVSGLGYDANGNINGLIQKGFVQGGSTTIDNLAYNYTGGQGTSNRLLNVQDASNVSNSTLGDFHFPASSKSGTNVDYTYDANGNITSDYNRSISTISYYDLPSLPQTITTPKGTIQYFYDASGAKLKKLVTENNVTVNGQLTNITMTTVYDGWFVYKSASYSNSTLASLNYTDILQYIAVEEGRIRFKPIVGSVAASFVHDYFIRDHLGNVRVALTDESQQDIYPAATGETDTYNGGTAQNFESQYYAFSPSDFVSTGSLAWYGSLQGTGYANQNNGGIPTNTVDPYSNVSTASTKVYQVCGNTANNPSGNRFGLGIALKVMAGDQVSLYGKSFWHNSGSLPAGSYPVSSVLTSLLGAFGSTRAVASVGHPVLGGNPFNSSTSTPTATMLSPMMDNSSSQSGTQAPYAGINWIIFDDQFRPITVGFDPVSTTTDVVKSHQPAVINIPTNGYIYVYVSNQSNLNVYFDNLQAVHTRGPLLEETHYYPTGLAMAGISDRAWNKGPNYFHYQGKEMQNQEWYDGTGLEEYDFAARTYDPQLGRWNAQDPAGQFASPYAGMADNWMRGTDPNGKVFVIDDLLEAAAISAIISSATYVAMNFVEGNSWNGLTFKGFVSAAAMGALSGALSNGFSQLGASLFSKEFAQSFAYNFMSNMSINSATNIASGRPLTLGGVFGSMVGAMVDGSLPNFRGFESGETYGFGDWVLNSVGELAVNGAKGGLSGAVSGGVTAAIDGGDVGDGIVSGMKTGALTAGIRTGIDLVVLGPAIRPNDKITPKLRKMESDLNISLIDDPYGPVYRVGGLWRRGLSVGMSHMINDGTGNINDVDTWIHESYHYYQFLTQGWWGQLWNGAKEQWFYSSKIYDSPYDDPNTNEGAAQKYSNTHH